MSPLKTLAKIQSTFKKYEKKMYDFIGTNVDNYEELREYWDDNWSDKISQTIPDGRKEPKKEEPKKLKKDLQEWIKGGIDLEQTETPMDKRRCKD